MEVDMTDHVALSALVLQGGGATQIAGISPGEATPLAERPIERAAFHPALNAARAAFKVGVKPSQIARQFGLSQSDVR
jgi:hypothetical protein